MVAFYQIIEFTSNRHARRICAAGVLHNSQAVPAYTVGKTHLCTCFGFWEKIASTRLKIAD
jgi:hypothetical protein